MKLYFHPLSGNSRRVLLVVEHLALPVERIVVDITKGEHFGEAHRQRNPNAKVPVLEDDGLLLWESRAIMAYLCDVTPGQTLYPAGARERADVNRWLFFCAQHVAPANAILVQEHFVKRLSGRGDPDPVEVARGEALIAQYGRVLDAHLTERTWVAQDRLTLADYSLAAAFALAEPARIPLADYKHLRAWFGRVQELPAWQRTQPKLP